METSSIVYLSALMIERYLVLTCCLNGPRMFIFIIVIITITIKVILSLCICTS